MDDGSGVLLPYMTEMRTHMRANAEAGLEAVEALTQYAYHFSQAINAKMHGVDLSMPENQPFRIAVKELQDEFSAYMDKINFSNPSALQALASQVGQFDSKLDGLPPSARKTKLRANTFPQAAPKAAEQAQQQVAPPPMGGGPAPGAPAPAIPA